MLLFDLNEEKQIELKLSFTLAVDYDFGIDYQI
jgi:hypothetical protein